MDMTGGTSVSVPNLGESRGSIPRDFVNTLDLAPARFTAASHSEELSLHRADTERISAL
jgi:hypothetical protein